MVAGRLARQSLPMFAAAALLLAAIVALAVWFQAQQQSQAHEVEGRTLETARQTLALADAEVTADARILEVLAGSQILLWGDIPSYRTRVARVLDENPDWTALMVRDTAAGGKTVMEVGRAAGDPAAALPPLPQAFSKGTLVEGVVRNGRYCPCVVVDAAAPAPAHYALTLFIKPDTFQRILLAHAPPPTISGLADRQGEFVARYPSFEERVGRPGSTFLRQAVARGGEGLYPAVTLEGYRNYTAFTTSPVTGWSAHIAIAPSRIDTPRTFATASAATAILAAMLLAAGLLLFAIYEMRRRRREETRMIGMQKAEAISRFTGTMAHDFRNILSVIDAGVRLIVRHTEEEATTKRATAIGDAVARGNRLVNQLLSFVRGDGAEVQALDLALCIGGADELLAGSLGEGIEFTWHVEDDARHACANADQFELALLNLAINARDAMDGTGRFTLNVTRDGEWAAVKACDSGPGVPPELRERIFEAFYSTKGDGKGTGLGLAQVAGAARQAGGRVELSENEGGGACFTLYLPRADGSEPRRR